MEKIGELLGFLAAGCYFIAVANLFAKQINRIWIVKFPRENGFRMFCQRVLRLLVRYHRVFGVAAGIFAAVHLLWQAVNVRISYSGVLATMLMATVVLAGMLIAFAHRRNLTGAHRTAAVAVLALVLLHIAAKF